MLQCLAGSSTSGPNLILPEDEQDGTETICTSLRVCLEKVIAFGVAGVMKGVGGTSSSSSSLSGPSRNVSVDEVVDDADNVDDCENDDRDGDIDAFDTKVDVEVEADVPDTRSTSS
jgi:hypothetical protein